MAFTKCVFLLQGITCSRTEYHLAQCPDPDLWEAFVAVGEALFALVPRQRGNRLCCQLGFQASADFRLQPANENAFVRSVCRPTSQAEAGLQLKLGDPWRDIVAQPRHACPRVSRPRM